MTILYKLVDEHDQSYGACQWGIGETHSADGKGLLCSKHWIHASRDVLLNILLNGVQGSYNLEIAHLWHGDGLVGIDNGMTVGCTSFTTLGRIPLPVVTIEGCVLFGILVSLEVYREWHRKAHCRSWVEDWISWAEGWLSGKDRSFKGAEAVSGIVPDMSWRPGLAAGGTATMAAWTAEDAPWRWTITEGLKYVAKIAVWAAGTARRQGQIVGVGLDLDLVAIAHETFAIVAKE